MTTPTPVDEGTPLDLEAIKAKWLKVCGACDAGIGPCNHPDDDYRPVMLDLVAEVVRLRSELATAREHTPACMEMLDERDAALKAIERVRAKHRKNEAAPHYCITCRAPVPCSTIRALDGWQP